MNILYFGSYKPIYSRNRVLIKGLRSNDINVLECNDGSYGFKRFIKLFFKYWRFAGQFDAMVVGFPGQEIMFLARLLTRKPIIFDAFTSHYGGYIMDRKYFTPNSLRAKYYRFMDTWSCKLADLVLLDTSAHIDFFVREFKLPRSKFRRIFVGTDSGVFYPRKDGSGNDFLIHFHGSYIPLQGIKYIIKAAKELEDKNIRFNLIGRGQTYNQDLHLARELEVGNINFIDPVPYDVLADYINNSDICLGIFGDSEKTGLVIPNKVFEALACGKPVITAATDATRELLKDGENVLFCNAGDSKDLAAKIMELIRDDNSRNKIADNGYKLFKEKLTEIELGKQLKNIILESGLL